MGAGPDARQEGDRLITPDRGTYVVSGSGYPGTGPIFLGSGGDPAVPADNHVWMYVTGTVNWRVGKIMMVPGPDEGERMLAQAMRRRENKITYRAERAAAVVWDPCCTLAIYVDLSDGVC